MSRRRSIGVVLVAKSRGGAVVEQLSATIEEYYDGSVPLIDEDSHRAARGIVAIEGWVYGPSGKLEQRFENQYSEDGAFVRGRTTHADGTVTEG